jgi:hypothetical protein
MCRHAFFILHELFLSEFSWTFPHSTDICSIGQSHTSGTMRLTDHLSAFESVFLL